MTATRTLIADVAAARQQLLQALAPVTEAQAIWTPEPTVWCVRDIVEHLYWAEFSGVALMWKTLLEIRRGARAAETASPHQDLSIEQVVARTWAERERVPESAAPRFGGSLAFWRSALNSLQAPLDAFGDDLGDAELSLQAQPHPISGPLCFRQRLEFLAFHIRRHHGQVAAVVAAMPEALPDTRPARGG